MFTLVLIQIHHLPLHVIPTINVQNCCQMSHNCCLLAWLISCNFHWYFRSNIILIFIQHFCFRDAICEIFFQTWSFRLWFPNWFLAIHSRTWIQVFPTRNTIASTGTAFNRNLAAPKLWWYRASNWYLIFETKNSFLIFSYLNEKEEELHSYLVLKLDFRWGGFLIEAWHWICFEGETLSQHLHLSFLVFLF